MYCLIKSWCLALITANSQKNPSEMKNKDWPVTQNLRLDLVTSFSPDTVFWSSLCGCCVCTRGFLHTLLSAQIVDINQYFLPWLKMPRSCPEWPCDVPCLCTTRGLLGQQSKKRSQILPLLARAELWDLHKPLILKTSDTEQVTGS